MKNILNAREKKLFIGDEPFYLASGDIHYFRIHPSQWRKRLELMKDFGLTAIQTYCPWNLHEPKEGVFDFSGMLDLGAFIDLCREVGLKVMLRPAPYICAEWDFGGIPSWVARDRDVVLRSLDERYINAVDGYYKELCKIFVPRLSTNEGPILAVALENEFGGVANDIPYLNKLAEILTKYGVDVPYYTTDGAEQQMLRLGTTDDCIMEGLNYRAVPGPAKNVLKFHEAMNPDRPFFVGELWAGRAIYWGDPFSYRKPEETSEAYREALELGAYVNFYMFAGGTNFGPMSGGVVGYSFAPRPGTPSRYIAHTTSYDEDALISEYGTPTEKYYLCRDVLDDYLGRPRRPRKAYDYKAQKILNIKLDESAELFDNLDALTELEVDGHAPKYMEDIGQDYGFLLYSSSIPSFGLELDKSLTIDDVHDRATVYVNGEYVGKNVRDREREPIEFKLPLGGIEKLDILVENVARINAGREFNYERKGIIGDVRYNYMRIMEWKHRAITLKDISKLAYKPIDDLITDDMPVFLKGTFDAEAGVDTFVHTAGFTRGYIWVNGFNLGRYWNIGPQMTLYVPGAVLKEKDNVIEIFDVNPKNNPRKIDCLDRHLLEMK